MKAIPSYPKIFHLGEAFNKQYDAMSIFNSDVVIEEKVDGSQFSMGINDDRQLVCRSRKQPLDLDNPVDMFAGAVNYVKSIESTLRVIFPPDSYFYCECLRQPKHNTLVYDRIPRNHLVLFGALINGQWQLRRDLEGIAEILNIDVIPELYRGHGNPNVVKKLLETDSYLGGQKIEGVVVKNYNQMIQLFDKIIPMFAKYVSEKFKEKHKENPSFKSQRWSIDQFVQSFKTETRWAKAVQHLQEEGILLQSPKDIGNLIAEVKQDIAEEEKENIMKWGGKFVLDLVLKNCTKGLPAWYKEKLMEGDV